MKSLHRISLLLAPTIMALYVTISHPSSTAVNFTQTAPSLTVSKCDNFDLFSPWNMIL